MVSAHIVLHCHNKWRDFPGTVLLKHELEQYGHRVTIVSTHVAGLHYWDWIRVVQPDVVVFPKVFDPPRFFSEDLQDEPPERPLSVVLPTEKGQFEEPGVHKEVQIPGIDLFLAWNEQMAEKEVENHKIPRSRIAVTGQHRFDWYHPRYTHTLRSPQETRRHYGIPPEARVATIAGSFPLAEAYTDAEFRKRLQTQQDTYGLRSPDEIDRLVEDMHERRRSYIDLIRRIDREFEEIWTVFKPHPFASKSLYRNALDDTDRTVVIGEDYSFNFLRASDVHVHCRCTTGLESILLDVPSVDFAPTAYCRAWNPWDAEGCIRTGSTTEVMDTIADVLSGQLTVPRKVKGEAETKVRRVFHRADGKRTEATARSIHDAMEHFGITGTSREKSFRVSLLRDYGINAYLQGWRDSLGLVGRAIINGFNIMKVAAGALAHATPKPLGTLGVDLDTEETARWEARIREARLDRDRTEERSDLDNLQK